MQNSEDQRSVKHQYLLAIVVNLLLIVFGISCGWSSPSISLLTSNESPLPSGKITMDEASWTASFLCIGGLIGNVFFALITRHFGRKKPLIFISIPTIIGWMLVLYAQNVYYLYLARLLNGFMGAGLYMIIPQFFTEIASDRVRGILGSTLVFSSNIGVLLAFIFGNYLDYFATPKIVIALTSVFAVALYFFPESPLVLMKQNKISETEKSIRFYQSIRRNSLIEFEVNKLKVFVGKDAITRKERKSIHWSDLTTGAGKRAMIIAIVLFAINQFSGCFAMLSYTATIFEISGSTMSPNMSAIVVGALQLLGAYVATLLVDRTGRKFLLSVSTIGCAIGEIILGVYMMLKSWHYDVDSFNWIPVVSFSIVLFMASCAILTLSPLVISEVMPDKIKDIGPLICYTFFNSLQFLMLKFLPLLMDLLDFHGAMFLFASCCLLGALYIILQVPETKNKSYEEIMDFLRR